MQPSNLSGGSSQTASSEGSTNHLDPKLYLSLHDLTDCTSKCTTIITVYTMSFGAGVVV